MKNSLLLGKIFGIKLYVHWTFSLLIAYVIWSAWSAGLGLILWSIALLISVSICIVLHELGHALTAKKFRVPTKHVILLPIGGVAQLESLPKKPKQEMIIALAGPLVSLLLVIVIAPLIDIHKLLSISSLLSFTPTNFLFFLAAVNFWLAIFNLIPAFPMDGGRVLRAFLAMYVDYDKATKVASGIGKLIGLTMVISGFYLNPILVFIGIFVIMAGKYEAVATTTFHFLSKHKVGDIVLKDIPVLESNLLVKAAADQLLRTQNRNFVVTAKGQPVGSISREDIVKAIAHDQGDALVSTVMNSNLKYFTESMPLDEAWKILSEDRSKVAMVGTKLNPVGILEEGNIEELILAK